MPTVHYHLNQFPPKKLDLERLLPLIGPANAALARFDGILTAVPNVNVLLSPLTTQEAVLSSRIEGTQATFGEVLEFEAEEGTASEAKKADIYEVINYRSALQQAILQMETIPLSQRLIKGAHRVLMQGVRGENKAPGEYRRNQNWIGPAGCTAANAHFVPISADKLPHAMSEWEKYLHSDTSDALLQLAILHVESEAIHPFLDGNGRLGRLLIPLYLVDKQLLASPNFYMSAYFEQHRDEYYDRLLAVSRDLDWTGWCEFFLKGVIEQARENHSKARAILDLYQAKKVEFIKSTRSQHAITALDWFFTKPIFVSTDFFAHSGVPPASAKRILRLARDRGELDLLREGQGQRPPVFCFRELIEITEGHTLF